MKQNLLQAVFRLGVVLFMVIAGHVAFGQTTVFYDGFEGAFPGSWVVGNNNANTVAKWGDNNAKHYSGSWSAFCADNGSDSRTTYDNSLNTYMQRQGVSLSGYNTATLTFKYWMNTEADHDTFQVNVRSQSGTWANLMTISGNQSSSGWQTGNVNMNSYAGQTGLIISFDFVSDGSVVPSGAAGVWVDDVSLVASCSGSVSATLRNVGGANAPAAGTRFLLYTSPTRQTTGSNPGSFSAVPCGTYLLEGYQTGTFFGEEFWTSQQVTVNSGQTASPILTRNYPYANNVVISNATSGGTISAGQTIFAGTQVRAYVTVRNDVPSTPLDVKVRFLWDMSQSSPYDYDSGLTGPQTISGSGGTRTFVFTFTPTVTGQYYYALEVQTSVAGNYTRTDSYTWTRWFNLIPDTFTLNATLANISGSTYSPQNVRFVLYTSPTRESTGSNPATFTSVPSGSYLIEGYQIGNLFGEEFWTSRQASGTAGQTVNVTLTRDYPYISAVVISNATAGGLISPGQTLPSATQVKAYVTVRNDVTGTSLTNRVRFISDISRSSPYEFDSGFSPPQPVSGSGGTRTFVFSFTPNVAGQYYFAIDVQTTLANGNTVSTDSYDWTQTFQSSEPTQNPANEFFDDFSYSSPDDSRLTGFGWYVRTASGGPGVPGAAWRKERVIFLTDPLDSGNRLMRLACRTRGSAATTEESEVGTTAYRFFEGTYAARVRLRDTTIFGPSVDGIVEAPLLTINTLRYDYDPDYSECDFEYLPRDVWTKQASPQMFYTTWETYSLTPWDARKQTDQSGGSLDGWHVLLVQISGGQVKYYIDGALRATHGGVNYPESPMAILFQMWFDPAGLNTTNTTERVYAIDVDWVYHGKNTVLASAQVEELVARFKSQSVVRRDTMTAGTTPNQPTLSTPRKTGSTFTLSATTQVGFNYVLEFKNSLSDAMWTPVQTNAGNGGLITLTNTGVTAPGRFYRVRVQ